MYVIVYRLSCRACLFSGMADTNISMCIEIYFSVVLVEQQPKKLPKISCFEWSDYLQNYNNSLSLVFNYWALTNCLTIFQIKRYPRVMENSVRRKKDHRKQKRDEIKERKIKEKEQKMVGVKLKKKLKKKEIEDKIEELKKLTGNDQLAFEVSSDTM